MTYSQKIQKTQKLISGLFKNGKGEPYQATSSQAKVFLNIIDPKIRWLWLSAPTRFGKSEILGMALLYLASYKHLKIPIVAGSRDKANKIMDYILQHLPDDVSFHNGLINLDLTDAEKLKVRATKEALRWSTGGWIYITSIEADNTKKQGEGVVGEGGDVVVLEEAGLIRHQEQFSKIVRMPEEDKGWGKLIMSGNMIEQSVFEKAYHDPLYKKIRITLEDALAEGRFTQEYLDQKKGQVTSKDWKRYYTPEFPLADEYAYFKPKRYDVLPREMKYYGAIDPALGESEKGSATGIVVIGVDDKGQRYEAESIKKILKPDEAMRLIFNLPYTFQRFGFEDVMFQRYFGKIANDLSKELGINIPFEGIKQTKNKLERIESMEPMINTGGILFKGDNDLWNDLAEYPNVEKMDVLDCLEMAIRISEKKKPRILIGDEVW